MHLHRTGGTTLQKLTDALYAPQHTYLIRGKHFQESAEEFKRLPDEKRKAYRMIKGHMFFGLHEYCAAEARYITILRNPLRRAVSQYYWHLRPEGYYPIPSGMTLCEFLESGKFISADNGMTRFIVGKDRDAVPYGRCTAGMLDEAKSNLQRYFLAVGLTEQFDPSIILFKRLLGWKKVPAYTVKNKNSQQYEHAEITEKEHACIKRFNELDMELYRYATTLFEQKVSTQDPTFADDVDRLQKINQGAAG
jgi:hypothetical protein